MIAIRVDGNSEIATGHMMRCLAIANGLKDAGQNCVFIVADNDSEQLIIKSGFRIINLHSIWNNLDEEIVDITDAIINNGIDKLIVDTYYVTEKYLSALERTCRVIYIDDLNAFRYPVSIVINYNLYARDIPYPEIYNGTETRLLLGPRYAPLRQEFRLLKPTYHETAKKILITSGGTDTYNATGKILQEIVNLDLLSGIEYHVIVGKLNSHREFISTLAEKYPSIILHQNVMNMAELMCKCDIAVSAGGTTLYEFCACGIPAITFSIADNQIMNINAFNKRKLMKLSGDIRDTNNPCIDTILGNMIQYISDFHMRETDGRKLRELVDGRGVERIVKEISSLDNRKNK
ncbi:MAG: UDP-2,4-diacetamido-2,4,6-trideoxy-beta-L-altropyranose hydrolase [Acholeplasmataceae bacterium]|nr:UDP-2,4-diacetamido-2,4,6-trideoxy-beta-L-altropyranose hydrolase [Acholeplasmataceae bacterium]